MDLVPKLSIEATAVCHFMQNVVGRVPIVKTAAVCLSVNTSYNRGVVRAESCCCIRARHEIRSMYRVFRVMKMCVCNCAQRGRGRWRHSALIPLWCSNGRKRHLPLEVAVQLYVHSAPFALHKYGNRCKSRPGQSYFCACAPPLFYYMSILPMLYVHLFCGSRSVAPGVDAGRGMGVLLLPLVLDGGRCGDQGVRSLCHPRGHPVHGSARHQEAVPGALSYLPPRQG